MLVNKNELAFFRIPRVIYLGVLLLGFSGCGPDPEPLSISGRIERNGKPVFPVVLLLQDEKGESFSANVKSQNAEFAIFGVEKGRKYSVAVEAIQLAGISQAERAQFAKAQEEAAKEGRELRREETLPSQFQNANIDFPKKYSGLDTSGLIIDCTAGVPTEPIVLDLK